ncbi:MAG: sodium:solute symporter [Planctomycetales bacterium]|nr:sodium:solute symporter [Planctomycetales bacterium]
MNLPISSFDLAIVLLYMGAALALGMWLARGQKSAEDYFLGGRSLPWWAVLLSTVATETSTVTFLSIPGVAFVPGGDMRFLQITLGYVAGRLLTSWLLLPLYFQGEPYTSYEVLQRRFGVAMRRACSCLFLVTRNLSDGLRLYLTALVLQAALGLDLPTCVVGLAVVTIGYTFMGGVRSVIWNDCIQLVVYLVGAVAALYVIISSLPEGWPEFWRFAKAENKLQVFDFDFSLTKPTMTFWGGLVGGAFLTAATHGADQLMVQRFLAARSQTGARAALVLSGVMVMMQFALFLLIGVGLAAFYRDFPPASGETLAGDRAFADFIVHHLGVGLVGVTLAAVFAAAMSTLSSSLNSSATALVSDLWKPLRGGQMEADEELRLGRIATIGFGALQAAIALLSYFRGADASIVKQVLAIAGFATGPMLGVYILGISTRRIRQSEAMFGLIAGVSSLAALSQLEKTSFWPWEPIQWAWYAAIGAIATVSWAWGLYAISGNSKSEPSGA